LAGTVEDVLAGHRLVSGPAGGPTAGGEVIESQTAGAQIHQLVRLPSADAPLPPSCESRTVGIEELTLAYLRESATPQIPTLSGASR
jgi:ABC-2 type transport system ATP-binding protein